MSVYTDELSSCKDAGNFYLNVLAEMIGRGKAYNIISMNLDIDRGVTNFSDFRDILSYGFNSLQGLSISQNYTSNSYNDEKNYKQFISFLKELKLTKFKFIDDQSTFTKLIKIDDIFEVMPANAEYEFKIGDGENQEDRIYKDSKCIKLTYNPY